MGLRTWVSVGSIEEKKKNCTSKSFVASERHVVLGEKTRQILSIFGQFFTYQRKRNFSEGYFTAKRIFFAFRHRTFHKDWNGYWYGIAELILPKLSTISDFRTIANLVFSTAILIVPRLSHPNKVSLVIMDGILFDHLS